MDTEAFARDTAPRQRKSRLQRFKNEIRELKQRGYADSQIRDWLAKNDVIVSRENVRKFIKRHLSISDNIPHDLIPVKSAGDLRVHELTKQRALTMGTDNGKTESQAEKLRRLAKKQRDEADQTQFKHDKTGNNQ